MVRFNLVRFVREGEGPDALPGMQPHAAMAASSGDSDDSDDSSDGSDSSDAILLGLVVVKRVMMKFNVAMLMH